MLQTYNPLADLSVREGGFLIIGIESFGFDEGAYIDKEPKRMPMIKVSAIRATVPTTAIFLKFIGDV